jgi:hypothetical protein
MDDDLAGWASFAADTPAIGQGEDDAWFASFAETENLKPKINLSDLKAQIDKEQSVSLKEVAQFNAKPQQAFTITPYPNGFSLARY